MNLFVETFRFITNTSSPLEKTHLELEGLFIYIYICIYICIFIYVFIYVFIHLVISSFIHVRSFYSLCAHSFLPLERGSAAPGRLPIYILNLKTFFLPEL